MMGIHRASGDNEISYIDVKKWPGDNVCQAVITRSEDGKAYRVAIFRPKNQNAVSDALNEYEFASSLSGMDAALSDKSIPLKHFDRLDLTLRMDPGPAEGHARPERTLFHGH